eukprot:TRINITY_DN18715_c0_g1_i1.p4 TRINITY_DN18715_c0_g1~~TRINITY_DN18715_c0_g1_i1.p4  ORF type:complete len:109 (-),score=27.66 TRINITY_DN18715_c0_g1_i1:134-460(-)
MAPTPCFCAPRGVGLRTLVAPAPRLNTPACRRSRPAATPTRAPRMQASGGWSSAAADGSSSNGGGGGGGGGGGQMEEIEFIIHADGRVEETVRGVKGRACNELTDAVK